MTASLSPQPTRERRRLRFTSLDEVLADAERITSAPHRTSGSWSAAQIILHVADLMHASLDGMDHIRFPLGMRIFGRVVKPMLLRTRMPTGVKAPPAMAAYMPGPAASLPAAMDRLRTAVARFSREQATSASPFFGPMRHEDWIRLHCRHAELHFSFMHPA